jgi:hypothetical protein
VTATQKSEAAQQAARMANELRERLICFLKSIFGLEAATRCHTDVFIEVISGFAVGARDYQAADPN